jgi:hypothetical protein
MFIPSNLKVNNEASVLTFYLIIYLIIMFLFDGALIVQVQFMLLLWPTANSCGLMTECLAMFVSLISPPQSEENIHYVFIKNILVTQ